MKKQFLSALALTAVTAALMAPAAMAQNIAIVNGKAVPKERLDAFAQQLARAGRPVTPDMQGQLREAIIAREVFAQEAQTRGLDASDEYKAKLEFAKQSLLIDELFSDAQKKNPVTDEEVKAEYDKYVAQAGGKEYRARHILVEKESVAKSIIAQLKKGAKFENLAKKQSIDKGSGANGGDLDWANASSYVKEFSDAMVALSKGKTTDTPVKSQYGYHVIRLEDVREAQVPKLEEVQQQIAQQLTQQKMTKFQEDLRAKAKVE